MNCLRIRDIAYVFVLLSVALDLSFAVELSHLCQGVHETTLSSIPDDPDEDAVSRTGMFYQGSHQCHPCLLSPYSLLGGSALTFRAEPREPPRRVLFARPHARPHTLDYTEFIPERAPPRA